MHDHVDGVMMLLRGGCEAVHLLVGERNSNMVLEEGAVLKMLRSIKAGQQWFF